MLNLQVLFAVEDFPKLEEMVLARDQNTAIGWQGGKKDPALIRLERILHLEGVGVPDFDIVFVIALGGEEFIAVRTEKEVSNLGF